MMNTMVKNLSHGSDTQHSSSHQHTTHAAHHTDHHSNTHHLNSHFGEIINNASKTKYPRVGKMDREGQIFEDGKVDTFVVREKGPRETQCTAT